MNVQDPPIEQLRLEFGNHKTIPKKYEAEILTALSHYPGLKNTAINFMLALNATVPYGTKPSFISCLKPRNKREYIITILETAEGPEEKALFKHLSPRMRIGVIGHELAHVKQFENCSPLSLLKTLGSFLIARARRKIERGADKAAIKHGFGQELLEHAVYIRSIPGYVEKRPKLNKDYLLPDEIRYYILHPEQIQAV